MNIDGLRKELKRQKIDIWQCDYFDVSGRIQVVARIKQSRFRNIVTFEQAAAKIRTILKAIQKVGPGGYDVRVGIKIPNGATVVTAIFSESVVISTDWDNATDWYALSSEFHVASQLPGAPKAVFN